MEKFYTIKDNFVEIKISSEIYPLISVKKAISNFFEDVYVKIESDNDQINILLASKNNNVDLERLVGEFYNELLRESLRYNIAIDTKNLRELIVGRALYETCIDINNEDNVEMQSQESKDDTEPINEYTIDDIAVNWFDKNNKEE